VGPAVYTLALLFPVQALTSDHFFVSSYPSTGRHKKASPVVLICLLNTPYRLRRITERERAERLLHSEIFFLCHTSWQPGLYWPGEGPYICCTRQNLFLHVKFQGIRLIYLSLWLNGLADGFALTREGLLLNTLSLGASEVTHLPCRHMYLGMYLDGRSRSKYGWHNALFL
jgi:hypothetical protein